MEKNTNNHGGYTIIPIRAPYDLRVGAISLLLRLHTDAGLAGDDHML